MSTIEKSAWRPAGPTLAQNDCEIRIPTLFHPPFEEKALEYLRQFLDAKTIIIDVRNNGVSQQDFLHIGRRRRRSRSRLFTDDLREHLVRHAPDKVTESMDQAIMEVGEGKDEFVSSLARRRLERTEW